MRKIVLASASPRRRELLSQVGITFEVKPASGEERITSTEPSKVVEEFSCLPHMRWKKNRRMIWRTFL